MPFSHVHPTTRDRTPTRHSARLRRWASLVPAVLVPAVGLIASAPVATADPYAAQLSTSCEVSIPNVVKRGSTFQATVRVRANASLKVKEQSLRGRVTVRLRRVAGGQIWSATVPYSGSSVRIIGPTLDVLGEYRATARFHPAERSVYRSSSGSAHFKVAARNTPDGEDPDADADPGSHGGLLPDTGGPDIRWLVLGLALVGAGAGTVHVARGGGASHDATRV